MLCNYIVIFNLIIMFYIKIIIIFNILIFLMKFWEMKRRENSILYSYIN